MEWQQQQQRKRPREQPHPDQNPNSHDNQRQQRRVETPRPPFRRGGYGGSGGQARFEFSFVSAERGGGGRGGTSGSGGGGGGHYNSNTNLLPPPTSVRDYFTPLPSSSAHYNGATTANAPMAGNAVHINDMGGTWGGGGSGGGDMEMGMGAQGMGMQGMMGMPGMGMQGMGMGMGMGMMGDMSAMFGFSGANPMMMSCLMGCGGMPLPFGAGMGGFGMGGFGNTQANMEFFGNMQLTGGGMTTEPFSNYGSTMMYQTGQDFGGGGRMMGGRGGGGGALDRATYHRHHHHHQLLGGGGGGRGGCGGGGGSRGGGGRGGGNHTERAASASPLLNHFTARRPRHNDGARAAAAAAAAVPTIQNPRNDYSQHFVETGERPQNFIHESDTSAPADRFADFPARRELVELKRQQVSKHAASPQYLKCDLRTFKLSSTTLGGRFDVILVDPPWDHYGGASWAFEEIRALPLEEIADPGGSFCFLWCGSGDADGLERGRECLTKWGYRRCEDICWLKTNKTKKPAAKSQHGDGGDGDGGSGENQVLLPTKEHCLVGIMGSIKRSRDHHIIHANVDTDVIITEEPDDPSSRCKPDELYDIIENFCLGTRRLELFGENHNVRNGWLTLGLGLTRSNFVAQPQWSGDEFPTGAGAGAGGDEKHECDRERGVDENADGVAKRGAAHLLPHHPRIEALRPKTPPFGGRNGGN